MKQIALISLFILALAVFSASARTVVIGPETSRIEAFRYGGTAAPDTLRILPRGDAPLEVEEYAFWEGRALRAIEFPPECRVHIHEGAFRGCGGLRKIILPAECVLDGQYIFSDCFSLEEILLPESLTVIPPHTFSYCISLKSILFPKGLKRIGNNAFSECRALGEVWIPDSVTELESYAFSECVELREARLPANGAMLGELLFSGCRNLKVLIEPSPEVPTLDCASFLFEPDEADLYRSCCLKVLPEAIESYRHAHAWSRFKTITSL
ncbi:MAG: leucine-rich repeat domain-containing protein [Bacteroides sp.]|nr:leucine-rich repeat domain-containing protein [Bacteroides sp.]MBD5335767.1 leucine-rich repeat domain-containing protein [Bacteroides sp.]MBD5337255.1 leucine-rich repeat domain-containing protein [Bacteroides sp.]